MAGQRLRVGIIGLTPERSWAARAHIPALRSLANDFELVGVANSSFESAKSAASALGIPKAFQNAAELASSPDIDIVTVTVRVPHHLALVTTALEAGKHVFCEWPLGNGLAEAETLAALAKEKAILGVAGTQARMAPEFAYLHQLLDEGYVGEVLSSNIVAIGGGWGPTIKNTATGAYMLDETNGATMLTIPMGHTLAAVRDVLGDIVELSAVLKTRRPEILAQDTGKLLPMTAPDQILVGAVFESGAPLSIHYRGGSAHGNGFVWEIYGTEGDIRIVGPSGHTQLVPLVLSSARGNDEAFSVLEVPEKYLAGAPRNPVPGNVTRIYQRMAADLRNQTQSAPNFADAVELHRLLACVESAAKSGTRVTVSAPNRPLPGFDAANSV